MVYVAWPPFRELLCSVVVPSLKVTVPVGVPVPGELAVTVAVKVTDWRCIEGFSDDVTALVVPALLTTWLRDGDVLPLKLVLPP